MELLNEIITYTVLNLFNSLKCTVKQFMHKSKETRKVRLDIVAMHGPDRVKKFSAFMQSISSCPDIYASKCWSRIQGSIYQNTLESFKKRTHLNKVWFEDNINVLLLFIKVKR